MKKNICALLLSLLLAITLSAQPDLSKYEVSPFDDKGTSLLKANGKYGLLSKEGNFILDVKYDEIVQRRGRSKVFRQAWFRLGNKWGIVNRDNKIMSEPKYDQPLPANEKYYFYLTMVRSNSKVGFIDSLCREIVPTIYDDAKIYMVSWASVKKDGKWGFIDMSGKVTVPLIYDETDNQFREGMTAVRKADRWGFVDSTGNIVITPKYIANCEGCSSLRLPYVEQGMIVAREPGDLFGVIDKKGNEIVPFEFSSLFIKEEGIEGSKPNGDWYYYDLRGKFLRKKKAD